MRLRLVIHAALCFNTFGIHYSDSCGSDEVAGEVQGETGVVCAPRCQQGTFACPLDVPSGTSAQPQCMLQDVNQVAFCGLMCQVDSQCPSGDSCKKVGSEGLSVCIHPLSFSDWASMSSRTKLSVGFPNAAGATQSSKSFQIAKGYLALQNLKKRFSITDSDLDVMTVKEFIFAASVGSSGTTGASVNQIMTKLDGLMQSGEGSVANAWKTDLAIFERNLGRGLPGLEDEAASVVWNVEHITNFGAASGLLRGLIELAVMYLVCGCLYKSQVYGATGKDMIPHIDFWQEYPGLVVDGIKFSQQLITGSSSSGGYSSGNFLGGGSSSSNFGGFQRMGAERDTFAQFEPSK